MQRDVKEVVETVAELCPLDCIYRSKASGTPICYYAVIAGESRKCKISECDKYKGGHKTQPRINTEFLLEWDYELYGRASEDDNPVR